MARIRSWGETVVIASDAETKMVYYFTSTVVNPPGFIYVGKDKYESEFTPVFIVPENIDLPGIVVDS